MQTRLIVLALIAATGLLAGCQTSILRPESSNSASAIVDDPVLFGSPHFTVTLDGKTYTGVASELRKDQGGEQALRFGWQPEHTHFLTKGKMGFYFGTTTLTTVGGEKLICDHLNHGDDWRLRCMLGDGNEIALYRVKQ